MRRTRCLAAKGNPAVSITERGIFLKLEQSGSRRESDALKIAFRQVWLQFAKRHMKNTECRRYETFCDSTYSYSKANHWSIRHWAKFITSPTALLPGSIVTASCCRLDFSVISDINYTVQLKTVQKNKIKSPATIKSDLKEI